MKRLLLILLFPFLFLLFSAPLPSSPFSSQDISADSSALEQAVRLGLLCRSDNYAPEISRAEFAAALCRMSGWELSAPETPSYRDCPADQWYFPYVETALSHDVIDAGSLFHPHDPISREEMAVMLVRALGYRALAESLSSTAPPFCDATSNLGYISIVCDTGLFSSIDVNGTPQFKPSFPALREEAAAMLLRVYERTSSKIDWLHGFYAFSSYPQIHLTEAMDCVSLGWARLAYDPVEGAWVNSSSANQNEWIKPSQSNLATDFFRQNGTPYHLNVYADTTKNVSLPGDNTTSVIAAVLATDSSRTQAAAAIAAAAEDYAGITIDFEGLKGGQTKADYCSFMHALRTALPMEKKLYVCVQPDTWYTGFDYRGLGEVCDKVILMAHDYQWVSVPGSYVGTTQTDSPVTPFPAIYEALQDITDPEIGVQDRSKIALAISFGTASFHVDDQGNLLEAKIYHPAQDTLAKRLAQHDTALLYSDLYRNPRAVYTTEDGSRYLIWYEDAQSVTDKIQLAKLFEITGVSLWRIGNIPAYPHYDVWSAILRSLDRET